jgi:IS5 family transposase
MHNLITNIAKFRNLLSDCYGVDNLTNGNFRNYSNQPKAPDIEIIALTLAAESQGIISENNLFHILESDYKSYRQTLPDRSNFNRRKRALQPFIDELSRKISDELNIGQETYIIDSMPLPIARYARKNKIKIMMEDLDFRPAIGYSAIDKTNYIGYKLNLTVSSIGVINNHAMTQANVHDVKTLEMMTKGFINDVKLLGDKGYIAKDLQLSLFEEFKIRVITPPRSNQIGPSIWSPRDRRLRKRIETTFSQFCDQFRIKINFAKSFHGFYTRIVTKIAAFTFLQYFNYLNEKPINKIKNALSF